MPNPTDVPGSGDPLADLRHHWGDAYNIQHLGSKWLAQRRDSASAAVVSDKTPGGLLAKIRQDYRSRPVTRPEVTA